VWVCKFHEIKVVHYYTASWIMWGMLQRHYIHCCIANVRITMLEGGTYSPPDNHHHDQTCNTCSSSTQSKAKAKAPESDPAPVRNLVNFDDNETPAGCSASVTASAVTTLAMPVLPPLGAKGNGAPSFVPDVHVRCVTDDGSGEDDNGLPQFPRTSQRATCIQ